MAARHAGPVRVRYDGLDTLRGATLLSMIAYHTCWDLVWMFGVNWPWYRSWGAYLWQQSICWTFILLSGFCFHLGRRRFRRGLTVFAAGWGVTIVTLVCMPANRVWFGVLYLLGAAALLTIPLDGLFHRIPPRLGLAANFALFLLTGALSGGAAGLPVFPGLRYPAFLYRNLATAALGFPPRGFFSTDYFPLLPWIFLYWTGYFLYPLRQTEPPSRRLPLLTALGRHSLPVYLIHQPVIYVLLTLVFSIPFRF